MSIKNNIAIIQARMSSTRLPGKVLMHFSNGMTLLDFQLATLFKLFDKNKIFIATTTNKSDDLIKEQYDSIVNVYRGSENDVLSRFIEIAEITKADNIIRMASDNPFVFFEGIADLLNSHEKHQADYTTFTINHKPSMLIPTGLFVEIVTSDALKKIQCLTTSMEKEHVTYAIYNRLKADFHVNLIDIKTCYPLLANEDLRFTVDTNEDFLMVDSIIAELDLSNEIGFKRIEDIIAHSMKKNLTEIMIEETQKKKNSKFYQTEN